MKVLRHYFSIRWQMILSGARGGSGLWDSLVALLFVLPFVSIAGIWCWNRAVEAPP